MISRPAGKQVRSLVVCDSPLAGKNRVNASRFPKNGGASRQKSQPDVTG